MSRHLHPSHGDLAGTAFQPTDMTEAEFIPALRTLRPHRPDRAKHVLTGGNALNASRRFALFRSETRTKRARRPPVLPSPRHRADPAV